jgi:hypothetical protein
MMSMAGKLNAGLGAKTKKSPAANDRDRAISTLCNTVSRPVLFLRLALAGLALLALSGLLARLPLLGALAALARLILARLALPRLTLARLTLS